MSAKEDSTFQLVWMGFFRPANFLLTGYPQGSEGAQLFLLLQGQFLCVSACLCEETVFLSRRTVGESELPFPFAIRTLNTDLVRRWYKAPFPGFYF